MKPAACHAENGVVSHGTKKLRFGELAEEAMTLPPPANVTLKAAKDWKLIGTKVRRLDTPEKITGTATFGMDIQQPSLRTALIARPPAFGAKLNDFDASAALRVPGVEKGSPDHSPGASTTATTKTKNRHPQRTETDGEM